MGAINMDKIIITLIFALTISACTSTATTEESIKTITDTEKLDALKANPDTMLVVITNQTGTVILMDKQKNIIAKTKILKEDEYIGNVDVLTSVISIVVVILIFLIVTKY